MRIPCRLRALLQALLPAALSKELGNRYRRLVFRRAMRRFLRDPEECAVTGNRVISDLIYGWGNPLWSALEEYLVACIRCALTVRGPILECGSGLTTLVVGAVSQQRGSTLWSLEHSPAWAMRVRSELTRYHIDAVTLSDAPIVDRGEFSWYEAPTDSMPSGFSLVICDGPPAVTRGGRYGLVPTFHDRLAPGCVILLDDAWREEEGQIARRWKEELNAEVSRLGEAKPYFELKVPLVASENESGGDGGFAARSKSG